MHMNQLPLFRRRASCSVAIAVESVPATDVPEAYAVYRGG